MKNEKYQPYRACPCIAPSIFVKNFVGLLLTARAFLKKVRWRLFLFKEEKKKKK